MTRGNIAAFAIAAIVACAIAASLSLHRSTPADGPSPSHLIKEVDMANDSSADFSAVSAYPGLFLAGSDELNAFAHSALNRLDDDTNRHEAIESLRG